MKKKCFININSRKELSLPRTPSSLTPNPARLRLMLDNVFTVTRSFKGNEQFRKEEFDKFLQMSFRRNDDAPIHFVSL
jgi:hypothetical protein